MLFRTETEVAPDELKYYSCPVLKSSSKSILKAGENVTLECQPLSFMIGIAGVPGDNVSKKSKTLEDNWIPTWDERFEFVLTVPELALLRVEVHKYNKSEKDDFGGQTCLPILN